jgi:hypothetical protein
MLCIPNRGMTLTITDIPHTRDNPTQSQCAREHTQQQPDTGSRPKTLRMKKFRDVEPHVLDIPNFGMTVTTDASPHQEDSRDNLHGRPRPPQLRRRTREPYRIGGGPTRPHWGAPPRSRPTQHGGRPRTHPLAHARSASPRPPRSTRGPRGGGGGTTGESKNRHDTSHRRSTPTSRPRLTPPRGRHSKHNQACPHPQCNHTA